MAVMRYRSRRATRVWLIVVGVLVALALFSNTIALEAQVGLAAFYAALVALALGGPVVQEMRRRLTRPALPRLDRAPHEQRKAALRPSKAAAAAQDRASQLPDYRERYTLLDVGLIGSARQEDGLSLWQGHNVSLDDEAIQPYAVLQAAPGWAQRRVKARFEMLDPSGETQYVCEERFYLRDGKNTLIPNYRLPLRGNPRTGRPGMWELRFWLDNLPVGIHGFTMSPSLEERRRWIAGQGGARTDRLRDDMGDDSEPISLEDLLRSQQENR